jgi:hypothetical protein
MNLGMIEICESDLAFWLDTHTNVIVRTDDFKQIDLPIGTSAYHYFGLASPPLPKRALPVPEDFRPQVREIIKLSGVGMADSNGMNHERISLRDLGHLPHERAITIDENENVVICGRDGKWVKTGEKLSSRPADVLQDSLRILDMVQQNNLQNIQEQLDLDPHSLINTSVYRRFTSDGMGYKTGADDGSSDGPVAHGIVKEFWLENDLHRWRILYDDSHVEDFDRGEMMEFVLPHSAQRSTAGHQSLSGWSFKITDPSFVEVLYAQSFQSFDEPATCCHRRILEKNPVFPFELINSRRAVSAAWSRIHSFVQAQS